MIDINYEEKPLTTKDVAELLHVPVKTVRTWGKRGLIQCSKKRGKFFFRHADLGAFMYECMIAPFFKIVA
jgi:hypothetical protein